MPTLLTTVAVAVASAPAAFACSVCFGDPESTQTLGLNAAIGALMGVTVFVLSGVAAFGFVLWKRGALTATEGDDHHG